MPDKLSVLRACRRVLKESGRLAFYVIHYRAGLSDTEKAVVATEVPDYVNTSHSYASMLEKAGFVHIEQHDVTAEYEGASTRWLEAADDLGDELREALGSEVFDRKLAYRRAARPGIESGARRRSLFTASAGSSAG